MTTSPPARHAIEETRARLEAVRRARPFTDWVMSTNDLATEHGRVKALILIADDLDHGGTIMDWDIVGTIQSSIEDAEFIAHARNDIPMLLNIIDRIRELHQPMTDHNGSQFCAACSGSHGADDTPWPCDTIADLIESERPA